MLRLTVLLVLLSRSRTAYVTTPTFADQFQQLYEKLEKFQPLEQEKSPHEKLYEKLEKLNSLTPKELTDEDEELLTAMQIWGRLDPDQLDGVEKDLQSIRDDDDAKSDRIVDGDDSDSDYNDGEEDDPIDWDQYQDEEMESVSTARPGVVTPSDMTKLGYRETVISAADPIAATNERPRILDDSSLTAAERMALRKATYANIAAVVKAGKCSEPQPRWLTVRQLAPAANIVYMPPCVQLHRCAPDSGCCYDEAEVCAPVAGKFVALPFYLQKADGNRSPARMLFFNHTSCACVSRDTLQTTVRTRIDAELPKQISRASEESRERQNDWRAGTEEPRLHGVRDRDDADHTAPPQLRRCTCPTLFLARPLNDGICSCVCEWADASRRRDCLSLARGREHFGMRDRVCIDRGDCNAPACEHGAYERSVGKCPQRRYRRVRYHHRARTERPSD
ncbi:hypothetical protein ABMA27_002323 [Loxostege sticticalis]|uniref:Platelet-derived growth factor (PDGF) family profile domain-containing protein n=1 Tax=Loxostege sticticalis TaxID=481309 RepID=A0ABR3HXD6_LOXSC